MGQPFRSLQRFSIRIPIKKLLILPAICLSVMVVWSLFSPTNSFAAPKSELWEIWAAYDSASTLKVDHDRWDRFLRKYVHPGNDGINRLAYADVATQDRAGLDDYIASLGSMRVSQFNRNEQLAFWINLYNALTVQLVLEVYPVSSIHDIDISPGIFSNGPWGKKLIEIEGTAVSLDDIEHRILRPIWQDPRLHYVISCAALGCPNIGLKAMQSDTANRYLDQAARSFINNFRAVDVRSGNLYLSSIYDWYIEDFGGSDEGVLDHLRRYAAPFLLSSISTGTKVRGYDYDWALNDVE